MPVCVRACMYFLSFSAYSARWAAASVVTVPVRLRIVERTAVTREKFAGFLSPSSAYRKVVGSCLHPRALSPTRHSPPTLVFFCSCCCRNDPSKAPQWLEQLSHPYGKRGFFSRYFLRTCVLLCGFLFLWKRGGRTALASTSKKKETSTNMYSERTIKK